MTFDPVVGMTNIFQHNGNPPAVAFSCNSASAGTPSAGVSCGFYSTEPLVTLATPGSSTVPVTFRIASNTAQIQVCAASDVQPYYRSACCSYSRLSVWMCNWAVHGNDGNVGHRRQHRIPGNTSAVQWVRGQHGVGEPANRVQHRCGSRCSHDVDGHGGGSDAHSIASHPVRSRPSHGDSKLNLSVVAVMFDRRVRARLYSCPLACLGIEPVVTFVAHWQGACAVFQRRFVRSTVWQVHVLRHYCVRRACLCDSVRCSANPAGFGSRS